MSEDVQASSGAAGRVRPIYGLDDRPELPKTLVLGAQHVLTMFGATVSVPLLFGPVMGMSAAETARLISIVMLASGVATLLQTTIGTRLPIVQGVSFACLGTFFLIIGTAAGEVDPVGGEIDPQHIVAVCVLDFADEFAGCHVPQFQLA